MAETEKPGMEPVKDTEPVRKYSDGKVPAPRARP